jgi:hypothetical protein
MSFRSYFDTSVRWSHNVTTPWDSISRRVYPRTVREAIAWGIEFFEHHGLYRSTLEKAVSYFVTDIEMTGEELDVATRRKYQSMLTQEFSTRTDLIQIGVNTLAFGNEFVSVYAPFTRTLFCSNRACGYSGPLKRMWNEGIRWVDYKFVGTCPICQHSGVWQHRDRLVPEEHIRPHIHRWPAQFMKVQKHPQSGRKKFRLDTSLHSTMREAFSRGDQLFLEDTPWELIEAFKQGKEFEFADDEIYHMCYEPNTILQTDLHGWGVPAFMADFEDALMLMLLDKMTEAIAMDHTVPMRVLHPPGQSGNPDTDPMLLLNAQDFKSHIMNMIERHRQNPTGYNFSPVPLTQTLIGGDAASIPNTELMEYYQQRLLFSMGIPSELQTSQTNVGPLINFKLFEQQWAYFTDSLNQLLNWIVKRRGELMAWEKATVYLSKPSVADDMQTKMLISQEHAAGKVSKHTYFKRVLMLDPIFEAETIREEGREEQMALAEEQTQLEEEALNMEAIRVPGAGEQILMQEQEAAMAAQGGAPPPMGAGAMPPAIAPPGAGSALSGGMETASLEELQVQADQIASQIMTMDATSRQSTLRQLASSDDTLHALVQGKLQEYEGQAEAMGLAMARQGQMPLQPAM